MLKCLNDCDQTVKRIQEVWIDYSYPFLTMCFSPDIFYFLELTVFTGKTVEKELKICGLGRTEEVNCLLSCAWLFLPTAMPKRDFIASFGSTSQKYMTEKSRLQGQIDVRKRKERFSPYVRLSRREECLKVTPELSYSQLSKKYTKSKKECPCTTQWSKKEKENNDQV